MAKRAGSLEVVAIIPARGGSKGIPRKNLIGFSGRPLIAWTIQAALDAASVGEVLVSSDDPEILAVARRHGAETPFRRPRELATDKSPTILAVLHAARFLKARKDLPKSTILAVLQPTSPLRTARDIDKAVQLFRKRKAGSVVSMKACADHPWWSFVEAGGGAVRLACEEVKRLTLPRQRLPKAFRPNGAIYLVRLGALLVHKTLFVPPVYPYAMPESRSVDINTWSDYAKARTLWETR